MTLFVMQQTTRSSLASYLIRRANLPAAYGYKISYSGTLRQDPYNCDRAIALYTRSYPLPRGALASKSWLKYGGGYSVSVISALDWGHYRTPMSVSSIRR